MTVAALYVETGGCYYGLPGVVPWDEARDARLIAAAPDLFDAAYFAKAAQIALEAYEADLGEPLDEMHELGRIDESRKSASFRIRVGHLRGLIAALTRAGVSS